jgi:hypothetical protein
MRQYPGWTGMHTRDEAPGAMKNGTRVRKVKFEPGDAHPIGSLATVLGSLHHPTLGYAYFVEWDNAPRTATAVVGFKIDLADG